MSLELALLWPPYLQIISMRVPGRRRRRRRDNTRTVHCFTRSDVTSVERGVRMSQCGQAPLGMHIEGVGDSHFS